MLPPLQRVDLSEAGWKVQHGQAVWKPRPDAPEITGDLLLATRSKEDEFIQFSKTLPMVVARRQGRGWEVSFGPEGKRYAGHGDPPARIIWFELARAVLGQQLASELRVERDTPEHFTIRRGTSEWLEIFLTE